MRVLTLVLLVGLFVSACGESPPAETPPAAPADELLGHWVIDPAATRTATAASLTEGRESELDGLDGQERGRLLALIHGQSSRVAEGFSRLGVRLEMRGDGTYKTATEDGTWTGTWFRDGEKISFVYDAPEGSGSPAEREYDGWLRDGRLHVRTIAPLPVVVVLEKLEHGEKPDLPSALPGGEATPLVTTEDPDDLVLLLSGGGGGAGYWTAKAADQKLAKMGAAALPALRRGITSGNLYVRQQCAYRLGMLKAGARSAIPRLIEVLAEDHSEAASSAAVAIGRIAPADPEVVKALALALQSVYPDIRMCAAEALGSSGDAAAGVALQLAKLIEDDDANVRAATATALADIGGDREKLIRGLLNLLEDPDWLPRNAAAEGLGRLKAAAAVPKLLTALRDESYMVRSSAAEALGKIRKSGSQVLPALVAMLADSSHGVRMSAIDAIKDFGKEAEMVREDLEKTLEHEDWYTRTVAREILDSL